MTNTSLTFNTLKTHFKESVFTRDFSIHQRNFHWFMYLFLFLTAASIPVATSGVEIFSLVAIFSGMLLGLHFKLAEKWHYSPVLYLMVALFLLLMLSVSYTSADFPMACKRLLTYKKLIYCLFFLPLFDREWVRRAGLFAFFFGISVTLVIIYYHYFFQYTPGMSIDPTATYKNHIAVSLSLALTMYFASNFVFEQKRFYIPYALSMLLILFPLFYLGKGRAGYFAFCLLFVLFFWQHFSKKVLALSVIAMLGFLCVLALTSHSFRERIEATYSNTIHYHTANKVHTSMGQRFYFHKISADIIKEHWLLGTGVGSYAKEYTQRARGYSDSTTNPHSEYFNLGVQLGIPGVLLLIALFGACWRASWQLPLFWRHNLQAVLVVVIFGATQNSWLMDTTEGFLFLYFLAMCYSSRGECKHTSMRF